MIDNIIPADVKLAAKRGFVRTTAQAYATAIGGGIAVNGIVGIVTGEVDLLLAGVSFGVAVVSPLLAGVASYLDITAKGIPADYTQEG